MRKTSMSDSESDVLFLATHSRGMTMEELGEAMLRTIRAMNPDEKAHLRAKMDRSVGFAPKSSNGKPS
jgi:hypothetical protein